MTRAAAPFSPATLIGLLVVGGGAFLLLLYAIGAGWTGDNDRNGGAHAAANGLNGFAGLVRLLDSQGHTVSLSRSAARLDEPGLLVITPQPLTDGEDVADTIEQRRYIGPTLVILPKWRAMPADQDPRVPAPKGWVRLGEAGSADWLDAIDDLEDAKTAIAPRGNWSGFGFSGTLPDPRRGLALKADSIDTEDWTSVLPLVTVANGDVLAGYLNDNNNYPQLDAAAGYDPVDEPDEGQWPVVIVAEPDLLNNFGLADLQRARLAVALIDATLDGKDLPIVFDLSIAGLGAADNLLTLAFRPPFVAATLCLVLAALVIAWRSLRRFGPPLGEVATQAMGKRQLALNGAALIERASRVRLLGAPYAALATRRLAARLGLHEADPEQREAALERYFADQGAQPGFAARLDAVRQARRPADLLRAAGALRALERTVTP
jgi:hypothetical protein